MPTYQNTRSNARDVQPGARGLFKTQDYLVLGAALIAFLFSVMLWFGGDTGAGLFVGLWVPSIIAFGVYVRLMAEGPRHG